MSLNYKVSRHDPTSLEFVTLDGDRFCEAADEAAAQRIEACVNACKDIETKYLNEFPNWTLAVAHMARPGDVANLILRSNDLRAALQGMVDCFECDPGHNDYLTWANAKEALK